ncbi:MAG: phosphatase [Candidatus Dadabacteria bacterium]
MIKAVIFDMDGVMIDSEPLWEKAERILLAKRGIGYNPTYRDKIVGLNQNDSGRLMRETFNLTETVEEIIAERIEILLGLYEKELWLMPGLLTLLRRLKESGFLLALASSSPIRVINFVLDKFSLREFFSVVVPGDFIELGKPHPDIYIYTAKRLGVETRECVVIEDSINGVKSAKGAGMFCIAVPDKRLEQKEFQIADLVVDSLGMISVETIKNLG